MRVNFLIENWMLVLVAVGSASMLLWPNLQGAGQSGLTPANAVQWINREKAVVVDVCEAEEYAAGHVVGSRNVPLGELEAKLGSVAKNKALPLILVCQTGARSSRALAIARKLGYEKAQSLHGGLKAWRGADLPLEKA